MTHFTTIYDKTIFLLLVYITFAFISELEEALVRHLSNVLKLAWLWICKWSNHLTDGSAVWQDDNDKRRKWRPAVTRPGQGFLRQVWSQGNSWKVSSFSFLFYPLPIDLVEYGPREVVGTQQFTICNFILTQTFYAKYDYRKVLSSYHKTIMIFLISNVLTRSYSKYEYERLTVQFQTKSSQFSSIPIEANSFYSK